MPISVTKREKESFDSIMKRFRREVQEDGILQKSKRKEFYEKPNEKKQRLIKARRKKMKSKK